MTSRPVSVRSFLSRKMSSALESSIVPGSLSLDELSSPEFCATFGDNCRRVSVRFFHSSVVSSSSLLDVSTASQTLTPFILELLSSLEPSGKSFFLLERPLDFEDDL